MPPKKRGRPKKTAQAAGSDDDADLQEALRLSLLEAEMDPDERALRDAIEASKQDAQAKGIQIEADFGSVQPPAKRVAASTSVVGFSPVAVSTAASAVAGSSALDDLEDDNSYSLQLSSGPPDAFPKPTPPKATSSVVFPSFSTGLDLNSALEDLSDDEPVLALTQSYTLPVPTSRSPVSSDRDNFLSLSPPRSPKVSVASTRAAPPPPPSPHQQQQPVSSPAVTTQRKQLQAIAQKDAGQAEADFGALIMESGGDVEEFLQRANLHLLTRDEYRWIEVRALAYSDQMVDRVALTEAWEKLKRPRTSVQLQALANRYNCTRGRWLVNVPTAEANDVWAKLARKTAAGLLGPSVCTQTIIPNTPHVVIHVYTEDYSHESDVMRVKQELEQSGLRNMHYMADVAKLCKVRQDVREPDLKKFIYKS